MYNFHNPTYAHVEHIKDPGKWYAVRVHMYAAIYNG